MKSEKIYNKWYESMNPYTDESKIVENFIAWLEENECKIIGTESNEIIGFNLSLNFGFADKHEEYNKIVNKVEDIIDGALKDKQDTGIILLGGKAEFIREDNDLGIKKL